MKNYLICYDISDPKRLAKVAKYLEKTAFRVQYSIFLLPKPSKSELEKITFDLSNLIDKNIDDLRIYTIKNAGFHFGSAVNLDEPFIF